MTILTMSRKELENKVGKITPEIEDKITQMGTPLEEINDNIVSVEIFPNRPDLLCLQNFAMALNQYRGKEGIAKVKVNPPEKDYIVHVDKSVKEVRPYTVCMIVKNIKFDKEKIASIIDLQEKLHSSIGRKRKKLAIGVYPLEKITLPITFLAKNPQEIIFTPLESSKEMNANQILKTHPTGKEYAHLLEGKNTYPVFVDSKNKILSMPPIINSESSGRISEGTTDVFVECSGDNLHYLKKALNILALSMSIMGGKIYSMNIKDREGNLVTPNLESEEMEFKIENISKVLGIPLSEKEVKNNLAKMGIGFNQIKGKFIALIPPYRTDILHWIDLSEEIAIAIGYDNFEPIIPKISSIGSEDYSEKYKKIISNILAGLGLSEVSSYHLTTKEDIKKMHFEYNKFLEVENSKNERDTLRIDLLTNQMQILSENSDASYPQKIYEIGRVFSKDNKEDSETGIVEEDNLAISLSSENVGFTELKQILDYLFKMIGLEYSIKEAENSNYISGRVGKIIFNGKEIGYIGEIAPRVIRNWKIKMPVVSLEISLKDIISN